MDNTSLLAIDMGNNNAAPTVTANEMVQSNKLKI